MFSHIQSVNNFFYVIKGATLTNYRLVDVIRRESNFLFAPLIITSTCYVAIFKVSKPSKRTFYFIAIATATILISRIYLLAIHLINYNLPEALEFLKILQKWQGNNPRKILASEEIISCFKFQKLRIHSSGKSLYLSNYDLENLPDIFKFLPDLENLDLSHNCLTSLPRSIAELQKLKTLLLNNNKLKSVPNQISSLKNLKCLNLSFNLISSVEAKFLDWEQLETLELLRNRLQSIPDQMSSLRNLKCLNLGYNLISSVEGEFLDWGQLETLDLNNNELQSIPDQMRSLRNLKYLNLCHNQLLSVEGEFLDWGQLETLDLCWNHLYCIDDKIVHLNRIQVLNLSHNRLKSLPSLTKMNRAPNIYYACNPNLSTVPLSFGRLNRPHGGVAYSVDGTLTVNLLESHLKLWFLCTMCPISRELNEHFYSTNHPDYEHGQVVEWKKGIGIIKKVLNYLLFKEKKIILTWLQNLERCDSIDENQQNKALKVWELIERMVKLSETDKEEKQDLIQAIDTINESFANRTLSEICFKDLLPHTHMPIRTKRAVD